MTVLFTGGSGCGKSTFAERVMAALPDEKRVYIATMEAADDESVRRVARHRAQRAHLHCATIEQPKALGEAAVPEGAAVLLEDLPNLLAGEMFGGGDWTRIEADLDALARRCAHLLIVTNDVFSDGVRYDEYTTAYLEHLAQINRHAAAMADSVVEVVYSIPLAVKGELPCACFTRS